MVIYTRKGDKGFTYLFNGQKVIKSNLRVEAYGTIDELNSVIGIAIAEIKSSKLKVQSYHRKCGIPLRRDSLKLKSELEKIQNDLLDIGSVLADLSINHEPSTMNYFQKRVREFEDFIDEMTQKMPRLKNFILPGGGKAGSMLHLARTICRRVERKVVKLSQEEKVDSAILIYLNRLSDLLFTMARLINYKENYKEIIWLKK